MPAILICTIYARLGSRMRRGFLAAALLAMTGCGMREPVWREYEENTTSVSSPRGQVMPPAKQVGRAVKLKWTAPDGWKEEAGSNMRIGSFGIEQGSRTGLCTIISLGGAAGGVDANVRRWIEQIRQEIPPAGEFAGFIAKQEHLTSIGGLDFVLVDLTKLGRQEPEQESMIGAIFPMDGVTVFLKFTGPVALLYEQKPAFTALCKSLMRGDG